MSGAIVPDQTRLDEFLRLAITVNPEVEGRWLDGVSDEHRREMRDRIQQIMVTAGVGNSRGGS